MHQVLRASVMLAIFAGLGCQQSPDKSPSKTSGSGNTALEDPRIEGIRARYQQIQADQDLKKSEFDLACKGGEGRGRVRLFEKNGAVQKAELEFIPPGHGEDSYQFFYDQREVVFALYDMRTWAFISGGTPDKPATRDRATQVRYYFHNGDSIRCIKKKAEGPTDKLDALLEQALTEPDDCSKAGRIQKLAALVLLGPRAKEELVNQLCP
ncbi:hypothetical protein F0U61_15585 [Archangium violaceum]|uniref:hypothetical protein n=1 Tax=Archangium violaceum TaxID=83451 RepID=UPI002B2A912A|nr:hypothetical protein F0U61_15585 [Archangium violaceum]